MKLSKNWLLELLPEIAGRTTAEISAALTSLGFEVESVDRKGADLSGVVVAEVLGIKPHPGADKLRIVRVRAAEREEDVVCGAPNVPAPGTASVAWAQPGSRLPGGMAIEAREVRGVMSPGMLCSEPELGLSEQGDGIIILSPTAPSGADFVQHFGVADDVLEVNVTPNRPDALSHRGIARELAAAFLVQRNRPAPTSLVMATEKASTDVRLAAGSGCVRYHARVVTGLSVGPSPLHTRLRLGYCGFRSISNLVDVTNLVLLETGHPLHAFDLDKVEGSIEVRRAQAGEPMTTLDGVVRTLAPGDIVIADNRGAIAIAGVMGGTRTEVGPATKRVLLEAAVFDPTSIRRTSRRMGLSSEASYRFERGVDPEGVPAAAAQAAALLVRLGGGALSEDIVDRYPAPPQPATIRLPAARLQRLAGKTIDMADARSALESIGIPAQVEGTAAAAVLVATIPTRRPDLTIPEDLIEEVLRLGGHYTQPAQAQLVVANADSRPHPEAAADRARDLLAAQGLSEVATWGFVSRASLQAIAGAAPDADASNYLRDGIVVKNPISTDYDVMRTSLLPGLAAALARNVDRGISDARMFEVGPVVHRAPPGQREPSIQREVAAGLLCGSAAGWLKPGAALDFFDAKRVLERLLAGCGITDATFEPAGAAPFLHPGVSATVRRAGGTIGLVGELHPRVAPQLGLSAATFYFEVDVAALFAARAVVRAVPPPRFPEVTRDISFWVESEVPAATLQAAFFSAAEPLLRAVAVLEDFREPAHVPAGKKGMLWTMTYGSAGGTLTDVEADVAHARVVLALQARHAIEVR